MKNLIQINQTQIGAESCNSVNARDLHKALESKRQFADWIKARLGRFVENVDYICISQKSEIGNKPLKEYILALDTAKMIAMLENNPKGDEVRKYFIECEKQLNQPLTTTDMIIAAAQKLKALEMKQHEHDSKIKALEDRVEHTNGRVDYFTIIGYLNYRNIKRIGNKTAKQYGKDISKICRLTGRETETTPDGRYGRVKTYPLDVLDEYFL